MGHKVRKYYNRMWVSDRERILLESRKAIVPVVVFAVLVFLADFSYATPNYARQQGISCLGCHALSSPMNSNGSEEADAAIRGVTSSLNQTESSIKAGVSIQTKPAGSLFGYKTLYPGAEENALTGKNDEVKSLTGFVGNKLFNATVFMITTNTGESDSATGKEGGAQSASVTYRLAYTPKLGAVGLSLGLFGESHKDRNNNNIVVNEGYSGPSRLSVAGAYGIDARINSQVGPVSLGFAAKYLTQGEGESSSSHYGEKIGAEVADGFKASAQVGFSRTFGLSAAYRTYRGKTADNAETLVENRASVGAWVNLNEQITVESQFSSTIPSEETTVIDESAFTLLFLTSF